MREEVSILAIIPLVLNNFKSIGFVIRSALGWSWCHFTRLYRQSPDLSARSDWLHDVQTADILQIEESKEKVAKMMLLLAEKFFWRVRHI